jgi:hypothetical protein
MRGRGEEATVLQLSFLMHRGCVVHGWARAGLAWEKRKEKVFVIDWAERSFRLNG